MLFLPILTVVLLMFAMPARAADALIEPLRVPAFTAYIEPDANGADVSEKGIENWKDAAQSVNWYGLIRTPGIIKMSLETRLPATQNATLRLIVAGQSRTAKIESGTVKTDFGEVLITTPGYQKFQLEGVEKSGEAFPALDALVLSGAALKDSHFNLKPRRNSASVHLGYPIPDEWNVEAFYNEVTPLAEPLCQLLHGVRFRAWLFRNAGQ